ncbi:MAG: hypothetical protein LBR08_05555 [Bacteroidales bacterium]|nr:hypothetical protein [Bacteroidales bacterium]
MTTGIISLLVGFGCTTGQKPTGESVLREAFPHPANEFRPMPFWHINGRMTGEGVRKALEGAKKLSGFGGVAVLPVRKTEPAYLSDEYFDRYEDIIRFSEQQETEVILYDDIDFPSGSAGGRLQAKYPAYTRKYLVKDEVTVKGAKHLVLPCPDTILYVPAAVSAMNVHTRQIIDLQEYVHDRQLIWDVPEGEWRVMFFGCRLNVSPLVDYMQPEAVAKFIELNYDEYAKRFSRYFGNVIRKTFYDDVGFVHQEETWTPAITGIFEKKYGKNPALYYPALYYDIGAETSSARVAFYDIRSELMAEGYVRQVAEWSAQHHLKSMGHPPENYSPNTTVANGDILKYYRHTHIPLMDAIFFHGRGIHGYKQVSSAADRGDKPVVGAEILGAFPAHTDSSMLYRVTMEVMARGVNFIVPHGMWYDTDSAQIHIPPLISHENPLLRKSLPHYSDYVARCCMMLQGGARISDIAVLWPVHAIQSELYLNRDKEATVPNRVEALAENILPRAHWLPPHVKHHVLSDLLTNELRRDFTFVHPEDLCNGKIISDNGVLRLDNAENIQHYKVLILPGGEVISAETLKAVRDYYAGGGKVVALEQLPCKSSEFGRDDEVSALVREIFGESSGTAVFRNNDKGGMAALIRTTDKSTLEDLFARMGLAPDVAMHVSSPTSACGKGFINYIHKRKEGKDIYFLTNSTDHSLSIEARLRGRCRPEYWNPYNGNIRPVDGYRSEQDAAGQEYTVFPLSLAPVSSVFVVSEQE